MKKLFFLSFVLSIATVSAFGQNSFDYPNNIEKFSKVKKQSIALESFNVAWQGNRLYLEAVVQNVTKKTLDNLSVGLVCRDKNNNFTMGSLDRLEVSGFGLMPKKSGKSWMRLNEMQSYSSQICEVSVFTEDRGILSLEATSSVKVPGHPAND